MMSRNLIGLVECFLINVKQKFFFDSYGVFFSKLVGLFTTKKIQKDHRTLNN